MANSILKSDFIYLIIVNLDNVQKEFSAPEFPPTFWAWEFGIHLLKLVQVSYSIWPLIAYRLKKFFILSCMDIFGRVYAAL